MNRNEYRNAKLAGARAAAEVHHKLGTIAKIRNGDNQVDVFESINELEIPVLCRPLTGLLGAYVTKPHRGILITTHRRLPIQRYTAAHELGHYWLRHEESFDTEDSVSLARSGISNVAVQEVEAEAFASEFLLPKFLLIKVAQRLGWSKSDLKHPDNVYQLSLRAGVSYEATWRALLENKLISNVAAEIIEANSPKSSKLKIIEPLKLEDPWSDVIALGLEESGSIVHVSPEDTVVIQLPEHSSSGYVWSDLSELDGIVSISSKIENSNSDVFGSVNIRKQLFHGTGRVLIELKENRPWEKVQNPNATFEIDIDFYGKEEGLPRVYRK
ncbi:MAG: ImmA/IrrE family metallo-endopeptidase [Kangiellaceae bacterium]|nr:ImmA/IrrE family metallo-endopeptidase [Kangiellaceae bacterium]MCW8997360.1 ImmA/IrrE family metallo-endopeptidase [Kangiellaceae bacterium]